MYGFPEIKEILDHPAFLSLSLYHHHGKHPRLLHAVAVAELTYVMAKMRGLDIVSATRAALLHDLYFYDKSMEKTKGHLTGHPVIALRNAAKYFKLNKIEKDAILHHMWPLTPVRPRFKESRLVAMADKASTLMDVQRKAGMKLRNVRNRFRQTKVS